jgi:hypothetical protein
MTKIVFSLLIAVCLPLGTVAKAGQPQFGIVIIQNTTQLDTVPRYSFEACNLNEKGCSQLGSRVSYTATELKEILGVWVTRVPIVQYVPVVIVPAGVAVVDGLATIYGGITLAAAYIVTSTIGHTIQAVGCTGQFIVKSVSAETSEEMQGMMCGVRETLQVHANALKEIGGYYMKPINGTSTVIEKYAMDVHNSNYANPVLEKALNLDPKQNRLFIPVDGEALASLNEVLN